MDKAKFQQLISLLESNNGKQMNHPIVKSGPNAGSSAIGEYGMMPNTIQQMAKESPMKSNLDDIIKNADPEQVKEILVNNPEKYKQYVDQMTNKVLDRSDDNPKEAAMRWLAGPNSSDERLNRISEAVPSRVNKIQDFMNSSDVVEPTYTEQLTNNILPKEVLYNKIRSKMRMP